MGKREIQKGLFFDFLVPACPAYKSIHRTNGVKNAQALATYLTPHIQAAFNHFFLQNPQKLIRIFETLWKTHVKQHTPLP